MTTRNAYQTFEDRLADGMDRSVASLLLDIDDKCEQSDKDILSQAAQITYRLERVTTNITEGYHVNSLGELQSSAAQFDIACALREERYAMQRHLTHVLMEQEERRAEERAAADMGVPVESYRSMKATYAEEEAEYERIVAAQEAAYPEGPS